MKKISFVFGTRPEAIKLAPVILEMKRHPEFSVSVCVTAQHRQMLDQVLEIFQIAPDVDLNLMKPDQSLPELTANAVTALDNYFSQFSPDMVMVQGDTTTVFAAALAAFYHKIPVAHVEAGLRTHHKYSPFPEEINRVLTSHIADLHFAPTELSKTNLLKEGISPDKIFVTGNTVIDALLIADEIVGSRPIAIPGVPTELMDERCATPLILITGHRRENFGDGFVSICEAISELAERYADAAFVYPVHLNPNVRTPVHAMLGGKPNIHLIEPLEYLPFVSLMKRAKIVLTDSGGVQEEAPSLGKPVLVMRENTERPEAVAAGTVKIVGTNKASIIREVSALMESDAEYSAMANAVNPYGDGLSAKRIVEIIKLTTACRQTVS
jgi:UDP-N-acetylglucosamine 2-epimerase (non-hydrolysing)